jgi:hypothetical protein
MPSLVIGAANRIRDVGTAAIARHCCNLRFLEIGGDNAVGENGARASQERVTLPERKWVMH